MEVGGTARKGRIASCHSALVAPPRVLGGRFRGGATAGSSRGGDDFLCGGLAGRSQPVDVRGSCRCRWLRRRVRAGPLGSGRAGPSKGARRFSTRQSVRAFVMSSSSRCPRRSQSIHFSRFMMGFLVDRPGARAIGRGSPARARTFPDRRGAHEGWTPAARSSHAREPPARRAHDCPTRWRGQADPRCEPDQISGTPGRYRGSLDPWHRQRLRHFCRIAAGIMDGGMTPALPLARRHRTMMTLLLRNPSLGW